MQAATARRLEEDVDMLSSVVGCDLALKAIDDLPSLAERREDLRGPVVAFKGSGQEHMSLTWMPSRAFALASQMSSLPPASKSGSAIAGRLKQLQHRLHDRVSSDPVGLFADMKPQSLTPCQRAGMCVCAKSGRKHMCAMEIKLRAAFRECAKELGCGDAFFEGRIVALMVGRTQEQCHQDDWLRVAPEVVLWAHLGHLSLKPWDPTWQELRGPDAAPLSTLFGVEQVVKGTGHGLTCYELLERMTASLQWEFVPFAIVETQELIGSFEPSVAKCSALGGVGARLHLIWRPWSTARRRKRKVSALWEFDFQLSSDEEGAQQQHVDEAVLEELERELFGGAPDGDDSADEDVAALEQEDVDEASALVEAIESAEAALDRRDPPPAPPPELVPLPAAEARTGRRGADSRNVRLDVPGGYLAYYAGPKTFYAVCKHNHSAGADCRLTRTSRGSVKREANGRPLGLLFAWLKTQNEFTDAASHRDMVFLSHADRRNARAELSQIEGSEALLALERVVREDAGEGSEPEDLP